MIYKSEKYEHWIQSYLKPRYPELVKDFRACLNGYERIKTNNQIDKNSLNWWSALYAARVFLFLTQQLAFSEICQRTIQKCVKPY